MLYTRKASSSVAVLLLLPFVACCASFLWCTVDSFVITTRSRQSSSGTTAGRRRRRHFDATALRQAKASTSSSSSSSSSSSIATRERLESNIEQLKQVLETEYTSFFDPMEREYYATEVEFDDPLTSLAGVDQYQANVDMLASRTLLGKFLFKDAGIVLHSITGGEVEEDDNDNDFAIRDIVTRWTLRMTAKILPWSPTARFTGVSIYKVQPGGPKGVQILKQTDYWDSINLLPGGGYQKVGKATAVSDFLRQLQPSSSSSSSIDSGTDKKRHLPFQLLRRAKDYQVRKYPSFTAAIPTTAYDDETTSGPNKGSGGIQSSLLMSPSLTTVPLLDDSSNSSSSSSSAPKTSTLWPVRTDNLLWKEQQLYKQLFQVSASVMAVAPVPSSAAASKDDDADTLHQRVAHDLQRALVRDGIEAAQGTNEFFVAKYNNNNNDDAHSAANQQQQQQEVWIELEDYGHPWSLSGY